MEKQEILEHLEYLQEKVDKMGFKGQNEYDLHLREEIADWIVSQKNTNIVTYIPKEIKMFLHMLRFAEDEIIKKDADVIYRKYVLKKSN